MQGGREVRIFAGLPDLSRAAADELASRAREAIRSRGRFTLVLAGGATPKTLYELLASDPAFRDSLPWGKVHFFFSDERHVPPDHPLSNFRNAAVALFSKIPLPSGNVHRFATELQLPQAADSEERSLREFFVLDPAEFPRFDLVFLGMGEDGHTASLFPGAAALRETARLAVPVTGAGIQPARITHTLAVFNHAATVVFLVSGPSKSPALRAVLEGGPESDPLPARMVKPAHGTLLWLVDREAAQGLGQR
jgi:6-phosphogluconolactonase